jgi:glycosyltransferase involved in cell wall biosynthesis
MDELISCVMLTIPGREKFLERAIEGYNNQTYPNRELIVVDGPGNVGEKRNKGCERAKGVYIAIMDDDDFSAPRRIEVQEQFLRTTGKAVTTFRRIPFVQDGEWRINLGHSREGIDSSLFFRRDFWESHPFQEIMIGQDAAFLRQAIAEKQFEVSEHTDLMYAENHGGNTCERRLFWSMWPKMEKPEWA